MNDPFAEPGDTREEILGAAYRALCTHGYSALTIQRIGDEFEKSPSLLYHHYDGKDELLVDLLEFLLDGFEDILSEETDADAARPDDGEVHPTDDTSNSEPFEAPPRERIEAYVLAMSDPGAVADERAPDGRFLRAVVELRAQATHDDAYRDHFERSDRVFQRFLERSVREAAVEARDADPHGVDALDGGTADDGTIDEPVEAREVAETVQTVAIGGMLRWATTADRGWIGDTLAGVERYLDATLPRVTSEE